MGMKRQHIIYGRGVEFREVPPNYMEEKNEEFTKGKKLYTIRLY